MCERLAELRRATAAVGARFDPALLDAGAASAAMREASAIKNMAATIEAMAAARVAECGSFRGDRSAAEHVAKRTGTSRGAAAEAIKRAERLKKLPDVDAAARDGRLSPEQASAIAGAGEVAPEATEKLLREAERESLDELRRSCAAVRNAHTDAEERRRKIQRERYCRTYDDLEGAGHIHAKGTPEDIAAIWARIEAERDQVFGEARREGRREEPGAYAFDALKRICTGEAKALAVRHKVIVRIDLDAFFRGYPTDGETCDVAGVPVAVSAVDEILSSAGTFLAAVITRGERLVGVAHLGRAPTAKQQTGLEWLYPTCAAEGCSQAARLQRDHRVDWARSKVTLFELLDLLCPFHHRLKTVENWMLVEGRGKRPFVPPESRKRTRLVEAFGSETRSVRFRGEPEDERHPQHAPPVGVA